MSLLVVFFSAACQGKPEPRAISVAVSVPDPAWSIRIERIYEKEGRLIAVSRLSRDPEIMAAQVISTARDSLSAPLPPGPVDHWILGRTWNWGDDEHRFVTEEGLRRELAEARLVHTRRSR